MKSQVWKKLVTNNEIQGGAMKNYIGIDVSKPRLDVDWYGESLQFENNEVGIVDLLVKLKDLHQNDKLSCVIVEASGGYEKLLVDSCRKHNIPIHVAQRK